MTKLSPQAQAVLDAFIGDAEDTGLQMDDLRENVAAALRAAAWQLRDAYENEVYVPYADDWLYDLATELENYQ